LRGASTKSIEGREAEGRKSLDDPSERGAEGRPADPGETNPFALLRLQTSRENNGESERGTWSM